MKCVTGVVLPKKLKKKNYEFLIDKVARTRAQVTKATKGIPQHYLGNVGVLT